MKKYMILILILNIAFIVFAQDINEKTDVLDFIKPAEVAIINDRDYVPNLIKLFDMAEKSIDAVIYQTRYYEEYPDGVNRKLYKALIRAAERGVKVRIICDQSSWNISSSLKNEEFAKFMRQYSIEVYFEPADVTTHSKIVVVDTLYTVVGSMNWSFYALEKNNECSVIVKSKENAEVYQRYFDRLLRFSGEELDIEEVY